MAREPSVEVGAYVLQLGETGGTIVEKGEGAAEAEIEPLREALAEAGPEAPDHQPDIADEVDEASEATAKVEKAVALCKGVTEGHALSPEQLALEVGSLLDCLERLDRKKKHKKALRMARALATLLMLLKRWADLLETLRIALRAGEQLGDLEAVAWAKHELGSLRLAAGDVEGAARDLHQAREIREQIGDRRGLATTTRNLQVLCDRLQAMLRSEELIRRQARDRRPRFRRLLAGATLAAFLLAGGVAAGMIIGGDSSENAADEGVVTVKQLNKGDKGSGEKQTEPGTHHKQGGGDGGGTTSFLLTVSVAGEGSGVVEGAGSPCDETCVTEVPAGKTLTLVAQSIGHSEFVGFSEGCNDSNGTVCSLTMGAPTTITATFEPTVKSSSGTQDGTATTEETEETTEEEPTKEESTSEIVE
jgi:tetratricopeptide (TPR) repeat protein